MRSQLLRLGGISLAVLLAAWAGYQWYGAITAIERATDRDDDEHSTTQSAYPLDGLSELVHASSAIVIASVGDVIDGETVYYHGPTATPHPSPPTAFIPPPPEGREVTYYSIDVEDVLLGDGVAEPGEALVLRMNGTPDDEWVEFGMGAPGTQYLYFLLGGNGGWYGIPYGEFGRLVVSGSIVRYSDADLTAVPFAVGMTPEEFLDEVVAEMERQQTATPTPIATSTAGLPTDEVP